MDFPKSTSSLHRKLVIPALAIMLVLSLGLVGVGHWAGNKIVNTMSEQLIRHMTTSIRDHVTIMMEAPPRVLTRVQNTVARHRVALTDPRALGRELYALLQDEPAVDWLYFANEAGGIVSTGRLEDGTRVMLMTDNFEAGVIREYKASVDGEPITLLKSAGYFDPRQRDWYKTAKQTRNSWWTKPYIGAVEPILGISISAPVLGKGGEVVGVYGLDLILTRLSEFMKRQRLGNTGRAFLVDEDGHLIASSGGVLPVVVDAKGRQRHLRPADAPDPVIRAVARHVNQHPEIVARSRKAAMQTFVFRDADLGRISAAVESFPMSNERSWLILSALPASEYLTAVREAGFLSLGLMALLIIGSLVVGFWTVHRVLRPLYALTTAAHVIAEGGWPEVPETDRKDEIGVLARALGNMARSVRSAHAELEQRVAQRTAELSETVEKLKDEINERIRIDQALQAETAVRLNVQMELHEKELLLLQQSRLAAMGEMIGNIAHQWRQPLNLLGLLAQELPMSYKKGEFSEEYLAVTVKKMLETIRHMSKTIDDFRNFSSPDKEKGDFRVVEVIQRTVSLLEGSLAAHQVTTSVVSASDPVVNGYPNEFSQALLNILINARDALLTQTVTSPAILIEIGVEGDRCVVTVSDNAGGIPEEIIGKIFDPYFTTKGPDKGTGIGLYMAKIIIEKNMGGRISVRNTADGAEFRIEI